VPRAIAFALAAFLLVFGGWVALVDDPLGGEPAVLVAAKAPPPPAETKPGPGASNAPPGSGAGGSPPAQGDTQTITIIDGMSGKRQQVVIAAPPPGSALAPAAAGGSAEPPAAPPLDPRLSEDSRHGPIPKVGPNGARASEAYAGKPPTAGPRHGARVAIVVGRLGMSPGATNEAFAKLPPQVTVALTPYGSDLDRWAGRARGDGREVLLQIPMEPFDYPENDSGPQTLLTSLTPDQNIDRLHWAMSRFQGYVGLTNLMGARFLSNEPGVTAIMRDVGKRGLVYVDDGSAARSIAGQLASASGVPFARADIAIDATPNANEIDAALAKLETMARERGVAVGFANALPISLDRIARWAKAAEKRGVVLVPITAIVSRPKSS
jgi:polysaccharide deacetylase 2 family uncharacterized protein YibQ